MSTQAKSVQLKSARDASVAGARTRAKPAQSTRSKSVMRNDTQAAELEGDAFDRAIDEASKAGLLDEMIAEAMQDERDGKIWPL